MFLSARVAFAYAVREFARWRQSTNRRCLTEANVVGAALAAYRSAAASPPSAAGNGVACSRFAAWEEWLEFSLHFTSLHFTSLHFTSLDLT